MPGGPSPGEARVVWVPGVEAAECLYAERRMNPGSARLEPGPLYDRLDSGVPTWHSRGYVPHFDSTDAIQHVTFRLADSLPVGELVRLEQELSTMPQGQRDIEQRSRIEEWMDSGHGCCILREPVVAQMVQASLLHFDGERYRLFAWVVMPNHVRVLFHTLAGWTLPRIVASWKSFTGRRIAAHMDQERREGQGVRRVWQREYWDRFMRDEQHFWSAVAYIHSNPVKAGLVEKAEDWTWSSASAWLGSDGPGEG